MGKPTGFMEYDRKQDRALAPRERIKNFNEFHIPLPEAERREQAARCKDCGVPFCQAGIMIAGMASGCPLNNLVPEWNDYLYRGNYKQALSRLKKTNNFPEFTSRVCPALCEEACTGHLHGDHTAVSNKENERAIIEYGYEKGYLGPNPPSMRTGKKVAVVGSGPSGLATADQLNHRGHEVTVFERENRPGGVLMYGMPNMKLEKSVVLRKTGIMEQEGVKFVTGAEVGKNLSAEQLLNEYDAVVLACGAAKARDISVPGRDAIGVDFAVNYLKANTKHVLDESVKIPPELNAKGKNVLIIGGGDTGNDCLGTAIRQGCKTAIQFEMMPCPPAERAASNPWPQWPRVLKVDYGQEEAIALYGKDPRIYQTTVKEFYKDEKGKLTGVKAVQLESKKDEKTGRMYMAEIPGSEYDYKCELVLIAAGFLGAENFVADAFGLPLAPRGNLATETPNSHNTVNPKVFAAGDCRRGQSLVVWAIREGRETARAVDLYLMGYSNLPGYGDPT
ncbi:MAG: glutamate synthase subunit beta [Lachnospiraceae bacterium]|nr:glutamate synthase subunit beta [Lachnospiraceae bacterium]